MTKEEKMIFGNEKLRNDFAKMLCYRVKKALENMDLTPILYGKTKKSKLGR